MVNLYAKNVPAVFDIDPNYCDKLFLENSYFENVSGPAVVITNENNSNNQITFRNVYCIAVHLYPADRRRILIFIGCQHIAGG